MNELDGHGWIDGPTDEQMGHRRMDWIDGVNMPKC
jgi:hypothetical protein